MGDKVVQTELSGREYLRLKEITKKNKMSIKEAVREAVKGWIRQQTPIASDTLFIMGPKKTGIPTDSSDLDKYLYGKLR